MKTRIFSPKFIDWILSVKCSLGDRQQGHEEGPSRSLMEGWFNLPSLLSSFSEMGYNEGGSHGLSLLWSAQLLQKLEHWPKDGLAKFRVV